MSEVTGASEAHRPPHTWTEIPDGCEVVAVPESDDWRVEDGTARCRHASGGRRKGASGTCGKPAVLALRRIPSRPGVYGRVVPQWWRYCAEHSYGRWVEDGQVMCWVLRETESASTEGESAP
jgi:hypothetical protein